MNLRDTEKMALMKKYGISKDDGMIIEKYLDLLLSYNKKFNLTGLHDHKRAWSELICPALGFYRNTGSADNIADIGSGNGIPGIVIAILNRDAKVTLIESRKNRIAFLREVKYQLKLSYEVIEGRAEKITDNKFSCIVGFRVADVETFLSLAWPITSPDGFVVQHCPQLTVHNDGKLVTVVDKSKNVWYYQKGNENFIVVKKCST